MFYEVVWQHMQGLVGFSTALYFKFTRESSSDFFCKSVKIWQNYGHEFVASLFWPTLYVDRCFFSFRPYTGDSQFKINAEYCQSIYIMRWRLQPSIYSNLTETHNVLKCYCAKSRFSVLAPVQSLALLSSGNSNGTTLFKLLIIFHFGVFNWKRQL